jgi:hypothetical protein
MTATSIVIPLEFFAAALSPYEPTNFIALGLSNLNLYSASFDGPGVGNGTRI